MPLLACVLGAMLRPGSDNGRVASNVRELAYFFE